MKKTAMTVETNKISRGWVYQKRLKSGAGYILAIIIFVPLIASYSIDTAGWRLRNSTLQRPTEFVGAYQSDCRPKEWYESARVVLKHWRNDER